MRRSGESAAIFEKKHAGPYGWTKSCTLPPWRLELDAFLWGAAYSAAAKSRDLHRLLLGALDAAFAARLGGAALAQPCSGVYRAAAFSRILNRCVQAVM